MNSSVPVPCFQNFLKHTGSDSGYASTDTIRYATGEDAVIRFRGGSVRKVCGDDFTVLRGSDEIFLPALMFGAKGAVGSTYNFLLPHSKAIWTGFKSGDLDGARESAVSGPVVWCALRVTARFRRMGCETNRLHPQGSLPD